LSSKNQLIAYAKACVRSAYDYFETKCNEDLGISISMFKCARLFDPSKVNDIKPAAADIDTLKLFPFLEKMNDLKSELPVYLATSEGVSPETDKLEWWRRHEETIPNWASACKMIVLVQPSSGAAERAFSILSNSFSNRQTHSLQDYIETSVMLQYNV